MQLGGKVLTLSDSEGYVHDPEGIDLEKIEWVKDHKTQRRGRISEYAQEFKGATFHGRRRTAVGRPVEGDVALPCATQNELNGDDARALVKNGCFAVSEGANMPTHLRACTSSRRRNCSTRRARRATPAASPCPVWR